MIFTQPPDDGDKVIADINMTPFVDVILVLLIIFMVTMPIIHHSMDLTLPDVSAQIDTASQQAVNLFINRHGQIYWNDRLVSAEQLNIQLTQATHPQTELRIHADRGTRYHTIAQVMAAIQHAGLSKIAFITEPKPY